MNIQSACSLLDRSSENGIVPGQITYSETDAKLLVVVDRQEFIRGCLNSWIKTFCREFNIASAADVSASLSATGLAQSTIVVFYVNNPTIVESWLDNQIAWLRSNRPDVSIVAIVEPDKVRPMAELVVRLRLQGCIPTSSTMEVAAAVLRLVAAGGTYIPHDLDMDPPLVQVGQIHRTSEAALIAGLTPRERGVLELLERGMSNKIIAYRLSLSQSTVKAHVHNIISKLKVHNRTEAAVASRHMQHASAK